MIKSLTEEQFQELQAKHPDLFQVETPQGAVYFRLPKASEIRAFHTKGKANNGNGVLQAQDDLTLWCTVYPELDELKQLITRYPLISGGIALAIVAAAEGDETARAKELLPSGKAASST
jgi:hypothetical protein